MKNFSVVIKTGRGGDEDARSAVESKLKDGRKLDFSGAESWGNLMPINCVIDVTDQPEDVAFWKMAQVLFDVKVGPSIPKAIEGAVAKVADLLDDVYKATGKSVYITIFRDASGKVQKVWNSESKQVFTRTGETVTEAIMKSLEVK